MIEPAGTAPDQQGVGPGQPPLVSLSGVGYALSIGGSQLQILTDVRLDVAQGEVVAIVGQSGSGKTSLLMIIAGLERPTTGSVIIDGHDLTSLNEDALAAFRRNTLGIVFQSFYLIPSLSALDNVCLALEVAEPGLTLAEARKRSAQALAAVGLGDRVHHRPAAMSGGEQQRVGLARAIVAHPKILLADEPTGNLDQNTGERVIELMFALARERNATVLFVTHDPSLAARAERILTMTQGRLTEAAK